MDNYTATELAYKNGYEEGYKEALKTIVSAINECFRNLKCEENKE